MPKPFIKLSVAEFEDLVERYDFRRQIDSIHMHHTWRPNRAQYRGLASIESMWEYHTQDNGWSDIAQHITIAPDGSIWTGRNWNHPPASARGYNGSSSSGPFMFEMIGDFDSNRDPFEDPQKATVIQVIAALLRKFSLPTSALRFHNHMTDQKSCPGTAIDYDQFLADVEDALGSRSAARSSGKKKRGGRAISETTDEALRVLSAFGDLDPDLPEFRADHLHDHSAHARGGDARPSIGFDPAAHLVNLRSGRLSTSGSLSTTPADLDALFASHLPAALRQASDANRPLRVVFYAHGGLGSEDKTLAAALNRIPWWLANGIYPIYFIWETGIWETFGQMLERKADSVWGKLTGIFGGRRGMGEFISDKATDPAIERLARAIGGVSIWGAMKHSAFLASEKDTGGAWLLANLLQKFLKKHDGDRIELHAVGHSAGSIFHAHFIDMAITLPGASKPSFKTLHHLAPAIRADLFKQLVTPHLGKAIGKLACFTMRDERERQDTCTRAYNKSLLYLIHHGLEPENPCPLIGLQRSIRADKELRELFEPEKPGHAEIIWSDSSGGPRHSSSSLTHGGFDDDPATMNSVCRRILGSDSIIELPATPRSAPDLPVNAVSDEQIALGILTQRALELAATQAAEPLPTTPEVETSSSPPPASPGTRHRRRALCIGIDAYPEARDRLGGCVRDAHAWRDALSARDFEVTLLLDAAATYDGIQSAFSKLIEGSRPGDVLAIHYSGHGTHFDDLEGDETDDDQDEALCCHDFRSGRCIIDDEIKAALAQVPDGVSLSLFMDCCHSGGNTRVAANGIGGLPPGAVRRYVPPSPELNDAHAEFRKNLRRRTRSTRNADTPYGSAREVLFAASLPHQFANEISGSGVFTSAAMAVLAQPDVGLSNAGFMQALLRVFPPAFRSQQEPRLYSSDPNATRPFLELLG